MTEKKSWFDETFLPSLFEKWQNRDKQYSQIILTEAQAQQCRSRMETHYSFSSFYGKSFATGMEYEWRGRRVWLQERGRYTFLSFGLTHEETVKAARDEEERQHQRRLERLRRLREKGPARLDECAADAQRRYDDAVFWLSKDDNDAEDIAFYETSAKRASEELAICRGCG